MSAADKLRDTVKSFEREVEKETARRQKAKDQLEKVGRDLGEADPDSGAFLKLISERAAAEERVAAFDFRVQRVSEQLSKVRAELSRAESADQLEAAKAAMQGVAAAGREMNRIAASARSKLEVLHVDFVKALDAANAAYGALPIELRDEVGGPASHSPWAQAYVGNDILEVAAKLSRGT